jgi:hypothetical protein
VVRGVVGDRDLESRLESPGLGLAIRVCVFPFVTNGEGVRPPTDDAHLVRVRSDRRKVALRSRSVFLSSACSAPRQLMSGD